VLRVAAAVGEAVYVDDGFRVLLQCLRDAAERLVEVRLDDRFINVKQHFALDVELDGAFVDALNLHAAVGDLLLQLFLLAVHVVTDGSPCQGTCDRADVAAFVVVNLVTDDAAGEGADSSTHRGGLVRHAAETAASGLTAGDHHRGQACDKAKIAFFHGFFSVGLRPRHDSDSRRPLH